jgi:hypothetical protein
VILAGLGMAKIIQEIFCEPPIVIARLGGNTTPLAAYSWAPSPNPRNDDDTVIIPDWSFDVLPDGSLSPFKPNAIRFRDGNLIRPVCPFIEVWARMGAPGSDRASWSEVPLTEALLKAAGGDRSALTFTVDAHNAKAARRVPNPDLTYGLFPSAQIRGDRHDPVALLAVNPPAVARPMIPQGRSIPLGAVQVIRARPNPATPQGWPDGIDLDVIRLRFTPGRGRFYGPREAANPTSDNPVPAVTPENAFLDSGAGWFSSPGQGGGFVEPSDTFDFRADGNSLGVVDDTCEARIDVELKLAGAAAPLLSAHVNIMVGPPDFAPDRRPFLSIADDLNDRSANAAARNAQLQGADLDRWVEDLFERAYETVSLMNVDFWRSTRGVRRLAPGELGSAIAGDAVAPSNQAMGSRDKLRAPGIQIKAPSNDRPLPLAERAQDRHRSIADVNILKDLVAASPKRLADLVRGPFEVRRGETGDRTTMRMPPFMRASNANPLTVASWQYDLLMRWAAEAGASRHLLAAAQPSAPAGAPEALSEAAARRRAEVLARFG